MFKVLLLVVTMQRRLLLMVLRVNLSAGSCRGLRGGIVVAGGSNSPSCCRCASSSITAVCGQHQLERRFNTHLPYYLQQTWNKKGHDGDEAFEFKTDAEQLSK